MFEVFTKCTSRRKRDDYEAPEPITNSEQSLIDDTSTAMIKAWNQKFRAVKTCKLFLARCKREEDREALEFVIKVLSESHHQGMQKERRSSLDKEFLLRGTTEDVQEYIIKNMIGSLNASHDLKSDNGNPTLKQSMSRAEVKAKTKKIERIQQMERDVKRSATNPSEVLKTSILSNVLSKLQDMGGGSLTDEKVLNIQPLILFQAVMPEITDSNSLQNQFGKISSWTDFNVFEVTRVTSQRPLVVIALHLFQKYDLLNACNIPEQTAINFFTAIEESYPTSNPYHNSTHATDVLQTLHALLVQSQIMDQYSSLHILALFVAAAVHDCDHPGVSSNFLIQIEADVAITYNDKSVLENHHLASFSRILERPGCNIFAGLSVSQCREVRRLIIEMVFATDMSMHVELFDDFNSLNEVNSFKPPLSAEAKTFLLRLALHLADVSNPAKKPSIYREWASRIMEEFFFQGDLEDSLGIPISRECDRHNAVPERVQIGFIDFIVRPLLEVWVGLYPQMKPAQQTLESNFNEWKKKLPH